jgi:WD40 repeat protein
VESVAFNLGGATLASGSDDHTIRLWNTNISQDIQRICAGTSDLTRMEWQTYIPDVTDPPHC